MVRRVVGTTILAITVAACGQSIAPTSSPTPTTPTLPKLSVGNWTGIPVVIAVNGTVVATVAPGTVEDPIATTLPPLPWAIEARSPSGRVLSTMSVDAHDYIDNFTGRGARANLACGRLDIWSGPPMLGPAFSPDPSRPCD